MAKFQGFTETVSPANLNLISDETTVKGSLVTESDTRLGGRFEGDLKVGGTVVVTEKGFVNGSIQAENITVIGTVEGDLTATKKALLTSCSNVQGNIQAERLVIEEGATFNGECLMGSKHSAASEDFVPSSETTNEQLAEQPA